MHTTTKERNMQNLNWTIGPAKPAEVDDAEDAFNAYARQAESAPHRWGMEQEAELERLALALRAAYDKHNMPASERIHGL